MDFTSTLLSNGFYFNLIDKTETYVAFTLNGFDDQERNLTFGKTEIQVLKLKFHACNFSSLSISFKNYYSAWP